FARYGRAPAAQHFCTHVSARTRLALGLPAGLSSMSNTAVGTSFFPLLAHLCRNAVSSINDIVGGPSGAVGAGVRVVVVVGVVVVVVVGVVVVVVGVVDVGVVVVGVVVVIGAVGVGSRCATCFGFDVAGVPASTCAAASTTPASTIGVVGATTTPASCTTF